MKTVFVIRKRFVTVGYVPAELKGWVPLIGEYEVIKRTEKGYRLKVSYSGEKGSMYLDDQYEFFSSYESALEFIAFQANKVAADLNEMKLQAMRLMCQAHDELRSVKGAV